ncbi:MAG: HAD family hydrolase [Opitutaceae bacterium]|nr:HAD family hydrolase [Opitutaceae bacterium]
MSGGARPDVVVFDLDGTLLDSLPLVLAAISHAVEPFGERPTMEIFARLGGPPERFLLPMVAHADNLPVALARLESFHRDNAHLIQPYAGVRELLETVQIAGVRTAIWTGRDRRSAERLLHSHRLAAYFTTVVCGDDLSSHKPDPAGLREILRRVEVSAERALFVGDADVDVLGGSECGVDTLLIRHARQVEKHIAARSWRTVVSPADAFDVVLQRVHART